MQIQLTKMAPAIAISATQTIVAIISGISVPLSSAFGIHCGKSGNASEPLGRISSHVNTASMIEPQSAYQAPLEPCFELEVRPLSAIAVRLPATSFPATATPITTTSTSPGGARSFDIPAISASPTAPVTTTVSSTWNFLREKVWGEEVDLVLRASRFQGGASTYFGS